MIYLQHFLKRFYRVWNVQFWRRLCVDASDTGTGCDGTSLASMSEFTDLITISQMTPGPIAVNSATFVGIKIAGIPGALAATFGCILPSCIIVTVIAKLYLKYRSMEVLQGVLGSLRPAVVAMIASAGISILITAFWGNRDLIALAGTKWSLVVIFVVCMILLRKVKMNPIWVMVLAGVMKVGMSLI